MHNLHCSCSVAGQHSFLLRCPPRRTQVPLILCVAPRPPASFPGHPHRLLTPPLLHNSTLLDFIETPPIGHPPTQPYIPRLTCHPSTPSYHFILHPRSPSDHPTLHPSVLHPLAGWLQPACAATWLASTDVIESLLSRAEGERTSVSPTAQSQPQLFTGAPCSQPWPRCSR